jgi:hypothetical protein
MSFTRLVFVGAALLLAAAPASAQTPAGDRPYRGLFGGGVGDAEQILSATVVGGVGYDDNLLTDVSGGGLTNPLVATPGKYARFTGARQYTLDTPRVDVNAWGSTSGRFAASIPGSVISSHSASVDLSGQLAKGTRLSVMQSLSYQPLLSLIGVLAAPATLSFDAPDVDPSFAGVNADNFEFGLQTDPYLGSTSWVELSQTLARRVTASGNYGYHRAEFSDDELSFASHSAGGRLSFQLGRGFSARTGYGYSRALYASELLARPTIHNIDFGIDVQRALGRTRRTHIGLGTGTAVMQYPDASDYSALLNASLAREIGRTWRVAANYGRTAGFVDQFIDPVFSDIVSMNVDGSLNRRISLQIIGSASLGSVGLSNAANEYESYVGMAGVAFAVSRYVSLTVTYFYMDYLYGSGVALRTTAPAAASRQGVTFSVNLWRPLLHRAGRTNVTR